MLFTMRGKDQKCVTLVYMCKPENQKVRIVHVRTFLKSHKEKAFSITQYHCINYAPMYPTSNLQNKQFLLEATGEKSNG